MNLSIHQEGHCCRVPHMKAHSWNLETCRMGTTNWGFLLFYLLFAFTASMKFTGSVIHNFSKGDQSLYVTHKTADVLQIPSRVKVNLIRYFWSRAETLWDTSGHTELCLAEKPVAPVTRHLWKIISKEKNLVVSWTQRLCKVSMYS